MKIYFRLTLFAYLLLICSNKVLSQCGSPISTFPYTEGFETSAAWTSGGASSDWAWGVPSHSTISSAGGGTKAWCLGGLTGSFYNYSELSWIMSPCFDFTTLNYPWISFKIFWEDEYKFDGMVFQYSTNNGTTWTNVGAFGDVVNCLNDKWYNYNNITYLTSATPKHGWTGRTGPTASSCQGGNGSLGWVTAKHCMSNLAGSPNVRFRFLFGSGTSCNNFDGMAIDDILIDNAPPNVANYTYSCGGGANILNFTNSSTLCPTGYVWNFGDPASGNANASTLLNPSHTFSAAGTYTVTLTASGPCNAPSTITKSVTILSVYTTVTPVTCTGANNGTATAHVTGGAGPFTYLWAPGGQTTQTITGLSAGTYTVSVTNSCPAATTAIISAGASGITITATSIIPPTCYNGNNGALSTTAAGGTGPYTYLWNTGTGQTNSSINNIGAGSYCLTATDSLGCSDSICTVLSNPPQIVVIANGLVICNGQSFTITANASNGIAPYTYDWNNGAFIGQSYTYTPASSTTFSVTATAANGCVSLPDTAIITLLPPLTISVGGGTVACSGYPLNLTASGAGGNGNYSYVWMPGNITGSNISVSPVAATTYTVTLTDGCTISPAQGSITVTPAPSPSVAFVADKLSGCSPLCVNFTDNSIAASGSILSRQWTFGDSLSSSITNPLHCYPYAGSYTIGLTIISANGCASSLIKNNYISVFPLPESAFTSDPTVTDIYNPGINFSDNSTISSGIISNWEWTFGDATSSVSQNPVHLYENTGTYPVMLIVNSDKGCIDSSIHNIIITYGFTFYAPDAFTPNHDGNNDTFLPKGTGWEPGTFNLWIFDRWGNMCFNSTDMNLGWNGKANKGSDGAETDVYVWKVELSDTSGKPHRYIGIVSIVN